MHVYMSWRLYPCGCAMISLFVFCKPFIVYTAVVVRNVEITAHYIIPCRGRHDHVRGSTGLGPAVAMVAWQPNGFLIQISFFV